MRAEAQASPEDCEAMRQARGIPWRNSTSSAIGLKHDPKECAGEVLLVWAPVEAGEYRRVDSAARWVMACAITGDLPRAPPGGTEGRRLALLMAEASPPRRVTTALTVAVTIAAGVAVDQE